MTNAEKQANWRWRNDIEKAAEITAGAPLQKYCSICKRKSQLVCRRCKLLKIYNEVRQGKLNLN